MEKYNLEELIKKVPKSWELIKEADYSFSGIKNTDGMDVVAAYKTPDSVISINSYEEVDNFLDEYNNQLNQIKDVLTGKEWKTISTINPTINQFSVLDKVKVYVSVYEVYSTDERVSLQIFCQKDYVLGFLTSIPKPKNYSVKDIYKDNQVFKDIISILK